MRKILCSCLKDSSDNDRFVFLTGDLGFMFLEPLQDAMGERFINAGIAEQNMIGLAAGLAKGGMKPWVYSIAPFIYARAFEQIRNDICLQKLSVALVGNGGGYGYGAMGPTHHALEDYGVLSTLPDISIYIPAFDSDVPPMIEKIKSDDNPSYLRLGLCEKPESLILRAYMPWRKLLTGNKGVLVTIGPLAGIIYSELSVLNIDKRPSLWVLSELPISAKQIPDEILKNIDKTDLRVIEEHVAVGSGGQQLIYRLNLMGKAPDSFHHQFAKGYISARYGSQEFHRKENALDCMYIPNSIDY